MQTRMRELVTERISEAQGQVADLVAFTAQLREAASKLAVHTPDGSCDDDCGCRTDPASVDRPASRAIPLVGVASPMVACSLDPSLVGGRLEDWQTTMEQATGRQPLPDGMRIRFPRGIDVAALSQLATDEQTCCGFFTFTLGVHADEITLDVTGPADAQPVIAAMFGTAV